MNNLLNIINTEVTTKLKNVARVELFCYNFKNEYERITYYAREVENHKFFLTDLNELGLFVDSIGVKCTKTGKTNIIVTLKPIPPTVKYHGRRVCVSIASVEKFTELFNKYGTQAVEESDDHEYHIIIDDGIMWAIHWSEINLDELYKNSRYKYEESLSSFGTFEANFKYYLLHNDSANGDTLKFWKNFQRFVNVLDEDTSNNNKVYFYQWLEERWEAWLEDVMWSEYKYINLTSVVWQSWEEHEKTKNISGITGTTKQGRVTLDEDNDLEGEPWIVECDGIRYKAWGYEKRGIVGMPVADYINGEYICCLVYEIINGYRTVEKGEYYGADRLNKTEIRMLKDMGLSYDGCWITL